MTEPKLELNFIKLCEQGLLNEAKLFLEMNPTIDISYDYEWAFWGACFNGHLEVAQWLLQVKPNINISVNFEEPFVFSCFHGRIEVCKWLLQVKPDINISILHDSSFKRAFTYNHLEICKWFQEMKPYVYEINYNDDGTLKDYYINSKEEAVLKQRLLPLWLASDITPDKNNLFYRIPQDVSRYIISNYL